MAPKDLLVLLKRKAKHKKGWLLPRAWQYIHRLRKNRIE
jgi:hypothetical protein